jgi:hypothetical protein
MLASSARRALFSVAVLISAVNAQTGDGNPSCTKALAQENQLEATNMAAIQKQYVDAEGQYRKDLIDCGGGQGAAACITAAQTRQNQRLQQIDKQKSDEITRHKKAIIDIQNGACSSGSSAPGRPKSGKSTAPSGGARS